MTKSEFTELKEIDFENPILIEGLPGIGYVGKLAADHLVEELDTEKFGEMTSFNFPHHVKVDEDGVLDRVKISFYHATPADQELVIITGDVQATSSKGHYKVTKKLLDIAEEIGIEYIYSLGGYATGKHSTSEPKVVGASNKEEIVENYRDQGIDIEEGSGPILGVSGLLLGLGEGRGFDGSVLLGETHGMLVDHRSAQAVLKALSDLLDFEIDISELEDRAEETEEILSRLRKEKKLRQASGVEEGEDDLSYIG